MQKPTDPSPVGQLRPSQMLHTFGVGAIVDLPNLAAMIMGLDDWGTGHMREIGEERLLTAVKERLGRQVRSLQGPPIPRESQGAVSPFDEESKVGVPVTIFPKWLRCPYCNLLANVHSGLFELKLCPYRPDRAQYVHANCMKSGRPPTAVPARFLVSCRRGHLDDFPWIRFVHDGEPCDAPQLRLEEYGVSGTAADVWVKCVTCERSKPMSKAFGEEAEKHLPQCTGRRPHLRDYEEEGCDERMRTLLLGASNSWFSITLSTLSMPSADDRLAQQIEENWHLLQKAKSFEIFQAIREVLASAGQLSSLATFSDEEIWTAIEARSSEKGEDEEEAPADLKRPEWEIFSNPAEAPTTSDFQLTVGEAPKGFEPYFGRIVLTERLREVSALVGFTRIESPGDYVDAGEIPADLVAPLSRKSPTWVPASETRGEGLFLQFNEKALQEWENRPEVKDRFGRFLEAHKQWRLKRNYNGPQNLDRGLRWKSRPC